MGNKAALSAVNLSSKVSRLLVFSNVLKLQSNEYFRIKMEKIDELQIYQYKKICFTTTSTEKLIMFTTENAASWCLTQIDTGFRGPSGSFHKIFFIFQYLIICCVTRVVKQTDWNYFAILKQPCRSNWSAKLKGREVIGKLKLY